MNIKEAEQHRLEINVPHPQIKAHWRL
jgi:hypothetical protein